MNLQSGWILTKAATKKEHRFSGALLTCENKGEAAIFERLYALRGKTSAILISHNFANVMKADRICVLENGSIAELGNHTELMEADGIYARLFRLQADRFQE